MGSNSVAAGAKKCEWTGIPIDSRYAVQWWTPGRISSMASHLPVARPHDTREAGRTPGAARP
jgi:hypothetical protein